MVDEYSAGIERWDKDLFRVHIVPDVKRSQLAIEAEREANRRLGYVTVQVDADGTSTTVKGRFILFGMGKRASERHARNRAAKLEKSSSSSPSDE